MKRTWTIIGITDVARSLKRYQSIWEIEDQIVQTRVGTDK